MAHFEVIRAITALGAELALPTTIYHLPQTTFRLGALDKIKDARPSVNIENGSNELGCVGESGGHNEPSVCSASSESASTAVTPLQHPTEVVGGILSGVPIDSCVTLKSSNESGNTNVSPIA